MRRYAQRVALFCALLTLTVAGCSSTEHKPSTPTTPTAPTSEPPPLPAEPAQPGAIGVSPGGVTTRVDVPADATESQYGQACHAAKVWMDGQQGDPKTLVEPYLKMIQALDFTGPGNFNTPWANLTPAQQAGVIMASSHRRRPTVSASEWRRRKIAVWLGTVSRWLSAAAAPADTPTSA